VWPREFGYLPPSSDEASLYLFPVHYHPPSPTA
jgi:hypothetical protein